MCVSVCVCVCVCIIKKCVCKDCLDKYISAATYPPKQNS